MKPRDICESVGAIARPETEALGLKLWDVEYVKEGGEWYLRVIVDREGGVTMQDCEMLNRKLNVLIDELDPIEGSYLFEVSSAGVERTLKKQEHYDASVGKEVLVRFFKAKDGVKELIGILVSHDENGLTLRKDGEEITLNSGDIALVRLYFRFNKGEVT